MAEVRRVALLTARADVRSVVLRLAALVGAEVDVVGNSSGIRAAWRAAHAVIVGADLVAAVASPGLPRRGSVVVVTPDAPDDALWRWTVDLGATRLVVLPDDERLLLDFLGDSVDDPTPGGSAVAVVGGCGGAGASTFAAALALCSARTTPTLLVDGDRLGGGLDVLLGIEQVAGARWPDLAETRGRLSTAALTEALPTVTGCSVLSWDRSGSGPLDAAAAEAVVDAGLRGHGRVIVDLPRCLEPGIAALAAVADVAIVVVPATVRATAAAAVVAASLSTYCGRLQLIVRDPGSGRLTAAQVSDALALPVAATLHSDAAVSRAADRGEPPVRRGRSAMASACHDVLALPVGVAAAA